MTGVGGQGIAEGNIVQDGHWRHQVIGVQIRLVGYPQWVGRVTCRLQTIRVKDRATADGDVDVGGVQACVLTGRKRLII